MTSTSALQTLRLKSNQQVKSGRMIASQPTHPPRNPKGWGIQQVPHLMGLYSAWNPDHWFNESIVLYEKEHKSK